MLFASVNRLVDPAVAAYLHRAVSVADWLAGLPRTSQRPSVAQETHPARSAWPTCSGVPRVAVRARTAEGAAGVPPRALRIATGNRWRRLVEDGYDKLDVSAARLGLGAEPRTKEPNNSAKAQPIAGS